ncbi:MAG: polyphosphate kinase 1 [Armatimonadetes bacterium]|nr:polyphosphate kinase 1 [Armatimonadota bacterium]
MVGPRIDDTPSDLFISRQLSWLEFNRRVLELAQDEKRPVAERLRFLVLSAENLDGFFMKRVDALRREAELGIPDDGPWPHTPAEELVEVGVIVREMMATQAALWRDCLQPRLASEGLAVTSFADLDSTTKQWLSRHFLDQVFPVLTPLAVDPGRPFPYISNLSLSLAVVVDPKDDAPLFARVKVPANQPRWLQLPDGSGVVALEEVIGAHLKHLFRGMAISGCYPFRVTRSVDVPREEEDGEDLMDFAQEVLRDRRFAPVVRVEVDERMPVDTRTLLAEELKVEQDDFYDWAGPLALVDLGALPGLADLTSTRPPWVGQPHPDLPVGGDPEALFGAIRERDVLVHHPYHDYDRTVVAFVQAAATDPKVRAVKQSLYRTTVASETLSALIDAAEAGKEVMALLELKARLDEAANIAWAQRLEQSGIHTSYGFVGYKTHTRITLVVREEDDGLRTYIHFGTGDYNATTAKSYTDLSLFTTRRELGRDVMELFNFLSGYAYAPSYHKLVVAPQAMREHLLGLIEAEIAHQRAGRGGRIVAMMNALADVPLIEALYRASCAGVQIDMIIRRECGLRPGVPGASENIRVRSVLGDFLEHQRVFRFGNGGDDKLFIGSADWMYRNLDSRIEALVPIDDDRLRSELVALLQLYLSDTAAAWTLGSDGQWTRVRPAPGEAAISAQDVMMMTVTPEA